MAPKPVALPAKGSVGIPPLHKSGKINWKAEKGKYVSYFSAYISAFPKARTKKLLELAGWEALQQHANAVSQKIAEIKAKENIANNLAENESGVY